MLIQFQCNSKDRRDCWGSNLDRPLTDSTINLTSAGLQRHRVLWVREMSEDEIKTVGESGPTIDSTQLAEFASHNDVNEWLKRKAPAFLLAEGQ